MRDVEEIIGSMKVSELVATFKKRRLPLIREKADIEELVEATINFEHSRRLYVVDEDGKLSGTISLELLVRHVFSASYEPQIHPRFLMSLITAETAKDIMLKNPVVTTEDEEVVIALKRMIETNVKEIPVLDREKRVVADLTIVDLLRFISNSTKHHFYFDY